MPSPPVRRHQAALLKEAFVVDPDTHGEAGRPVGPVLADAVRTADQVGLPRRRQPHVPQPARFGKVGAFLAASSALWLAMHEISVLSAGFLAPQGQYASFNMLGGPNALGNRARWNDALTKEQLDNWQQMLLSYELLDVLFIAVYTVALLGLLSKIRLHPGLAWGRRLRWLVLALAAVDLVELIGQLALGLARDPLAGSLSASAVTGVAIVSTAKWLLVAALVVSLVCVLIQSRGPDLRRRVGDLWLAVKIQRFSLLAFLPIAVLAVLPLDELNNLFGQLPDVQRAWLDGWQGAWHAFAAAFVFGAGVLPTVFFLGRLRADWAARREAGGTRWPFFDSEGGERRQRMGLWLTGPLVLGVAASVVWLQGGSVVWSRLLVFCAVPLLVIGLSWVARKAGWNQLAKLPPRGDPLARDVMAVGDILTVAALSLAGLGMIRAFTGLSVLDATGTEPFEYAVGPWVPLVVGFLIAILPWLAAGALLEQLAKLGEKAAPSPVQDLEHEADRRIGRPKALPQPAGYLLTPGLDLGARPDAEEARLISRVGLLLPVSVIFFITMAWFPRCYATALGSLGAAMLAIGTLTVMLGFTVAYAQDRQPPELFANKLIRLKATPIISLLVFAAALAGLIGKPTDVHPVTAPGTIPDRPSLESAFVDWLARASCTQPLDGARQFRVRPMLMYGAEGGGIRATYWTAAALQRIKDAGDGCGQRAALFATGASGGALGVTVARFVDDPLPVVTAMSAPDALSQASVSLMTGDLLRAAAGIRFAADTPCRDPDAQGLDRAGLMETAWEQAFVEVQGQDCELDQNYQDFLPDPGDEEANPYGDGGAVTGHLVLTSSAARDGCRALLSQLDLSEGGVNGEDWPECGQGVVGPDSYDLFAAYGRDNDDPDDECIGNLPALTAGLVASRFPYVTPSAVVPRCHGMDSSQLIDGGYTDNTGLGTVVALAPVWKKLVRAHNNRVLTAGSGDLVVPMVVFLENGTGGTYSVSEYAIEEESEDYDDTGPATTPSPATTPTTGRSPEPAPAAPGGTGADQARVQPGQPAEVPGDWWPHQFNIPEVLVPPIGSQNARDHKVATGTVLDQSKVHLGRALCTPSVDGCATFKSSPKVATQVFVVHQSTQPSIPAPLGWVLSNASRADLDRDMAEQANPSDADRMFDPATRREYGSLQDVLDALSVKP
jgi:hypothetical protein